MRNERARQIQKDIAEVLLREWDPIGVADEPQAQDEYDGYVGAVYRLLVSGASAEVIAEHLERVERESMGFKTPAGKLLPVANKLLSLNVRLNDES